MSNKSELLLLLAASMHLTVMDFRMDAYLT